MPDHWENQILDLALFISHNENAYSPGSVIEWTGGILGRPAWHVSENGGWMVGWLRLEGWLVSSLWTQKSRPICMSDIPCSPCTVLRITGIAPGAVGWGEPYYP